MLPVVARAAVRGVPVARPVVRRCLATASAFQASAQAAATQPAQQRNKPVKEINKGININDVSTGSEESDRTLGETASAPSLRDVAYKDITVSDILKKKERFGSTLHTVRESDSVREAMQLMHTYNVGAILVTAASDATNIVGILSTRDFIKRVTDGEDPFKSKVSDMMTRDLVFTYNDATALHSISLMNAGGFRHLPVRDRKTNRTIGVLSIGDCVRTMMEIFQQKNEYLEDLVAGKYPA